MTPEQIKLQIEEWLQWRAVQKKEDKLTYPQWLKLKQ